jgi:hypothetical protein
MPFSYTILNRYRIAKDLTWEAFTALFSEPDIPLPTLHKVLTGRTNPNERTKYKLDVWIDAHRDELSPFLGCEQTGLSRISGE